MPRMTCTTRGIQALKPAERYVDYWSDNPKERGFGVRVYPSGNKSWLLHTRKTKSGKPIMVTLGTFPKMRLAKARSEAAHPLGTHVFPRSAKSAASAWVWSKRTAAAMARATGIPFTAHDLRRTVATMMGESGIEADTIGLVLNRRKPGVTTRHYDRSTRETAKRAALNRWAQRLIQTVTKTPATVTPIRARA